MAIEIMTSSSKKIKSKLWYHRAADTWNYMNPSGRGHDKKLPQNFLIGHAKADTEWDNVRPVMETIFFLCVDDFARLFLGCPRSK